MENLTQVGAQSSRDMLRELSTDTLTLPFSYVHPFAQDTAADWGHFDTDSTGMAVQRIQRHRCVTPMNEIRQRAPQISGQEQ